MNEKASDLIERYLYEVTRRVPKKQREDLHRELQALINDMCENASAEDVLTQLGNPAALAAKYRDDKKYLIGPEYYDNYLWVLKLVLLGVGISVLISAAADTVSGMNNVSGDSVSAFTQSFAGAAALFLSCLISNILSNLIVNSISAFGATTLIFAVMERQKVKIDLKKEKEWSPESLSASSASSKVSWTPGVLPPLPDKRAVIKRSDSIISIVFLTIFAALFLWAPELFAFYFTDASKVIHTIPVFNLSIWGQVMPLFLICFCAGLLNEIVRLVTGYYCKAVLISTIILDIIQVAASFVIFKVFPIWNTKEDFIGEISAHLGVEITSRQDLLFYWGTGFFSNVILGFICFTAVLETGVALYKTLRYGKE